MVFSILHAQSPFRKKSCEQEISLPGNCTYWHVNGSHRYYNLQTVHGVTYRGWFTGIGIGLDNCFY